MSDEGLLALEAMVRQWAGFGGGMPAITRRISASYDLTCDWPSMRLQCTAAGVTITAPQGTGAFPIADGYRLEIADLSGAAATSPIVFARNGSLIDGAAANDTLAVNLGVKAYFYRADRGDWRPLESLTLDSDITDGASGEIGVFPNDFDEMLPRMLAKRIGSGVGQALLRDDAELAEEGERRLRARYCKPPPMAYPAAVTLMSGAGVTVADSSYDGSGLY